MKISVVILTYNSEATIGSTIRAAAKVSDDIHVVDSFSSDGTPGIVQELGGKLVTHPFVNYGAQRNWAIDNLPLKHPWELHLDADEVLSDELVAELRTLIRGGAPADINGYFVPRLTRFLGREIRHGGRFPMWHMRLFRRGAGRCEDREYDQHFVVTGPTARLSEPIIDDMRMPLSEWVARHNRWSDAEVRESLRSAGSTGGIEPRLFGSPIERKRYLRSLYYRLPLLLRAFALFAYRYVIRRGFLDGKEGAIFLALHSFWFRFLVDAKLYEQSMHKSGAASPSVLDLAANDAIADRPAVEGRSEKWP